MQTRKELRGLTGLTNLGNTCFINSCIQILSHTTELNIFLDGNYKSKLNNNKLDGLILMEWDSLRKLMWSQNCIISPQRFIKQLQFVSKSKNREEFSNYSQNDSSEFFLFLIDCFHSAISREVIVHINGEPKNETDQLAIQCFEKIKFFFQKEYSEIYDLFYGIHVSQIVSLEEKNFGEILSNSPEPFTIINLPIPSIKNPSLLDCFDLFVSGEILEGDNAWFNEKTGLKQTIKKQIMYWSFPKILVIDVKRFSNVNFNNKNQVLITFPITELDLSNYVIGYNKTPYIYDLYAICNHHGGPLGGHYYSFIKIKNKWFSFNDTDVNEINDLNKLITPNAYCFFYKKQENL
jgi:ubiquitin C-terminal hydrolase